VSKDSPFRGYRSIEDFVRERRLDEFANWLKEYKPNCHEITVDRSHYDLVRRWPRAAGMLGFVTTPEATFYRGFRLKPDRSRGRYRGPPAPEQTNIGGPL
jgi:hypothetical protein